MRGACVRALAACGIQKGLRLCECRKMRVRAGTARRAPPAPVLITTCVERDAGPLLRDRLREGALEGA
jgi:hypothetical protein